MISKAQNNNAIADRLGALHEARVKASQPWLAQIRQNNWRRFAEIGIPTTRHEEWKYFNLSSLPSLIQCIQEGNAQAVVAGIEKHLEEEDLNIVFINGVLSQKYSDIKHLPKGVVVSTLSEAAASRGNELREVFNRSSVNDPEPFVSLNTSLFLDGVFIRIDDKTVLDKVVHVVHVTDPSRKNAAVFPRTVIITGKSVQASILESFVGFTGDAYFIAPVTDIHAGENTVLNYYKAQAEGLNALHVGAIRVSQDANSQLEAFSLAVGSRMTRNNISVASNGEGTDSILDGLYVLEGSQEVDNHTLIDQRQPNCTSHQLYKGILNDQSHAVFNGKIFVQPIAQKTNSYQLNKHLLLGKDCRVDTKPQLEIFADDVKCTHGATIGQLNEDEVFYLQTRCISKEDAVKMLSRGFVDDLLDKLRDQNVRRKLSRLLARKIAILN